MNRILGTLLLFAVSCVVRADDAPKPNTLTPKEIADGWIMLFDGKTTFGWTSPNGSKWTIIDGMLAPQKGKPGLLVATTPFADFELLLEYEQSSAGSFTLLPCCDSEGKPRPVDPLLLELGGTRKVSSRAGKARIKVLGGKLNLEDYGRLSGPFSMRIGAPEEEQNSPPIHIALTGNGFIVRNIKLKPLNTKALFNSKDLSGWKEHPGRKSKFSVTKEGWLSVKDGPGDLQTTGQWDNFVLQLECKTNGKHLNSGVFFRCLPGQYQMGYEAQIHNGFGPEKDYTIEVFDRQTNKLIEKKKEKYTATDYGTGAIYRRQPARFQAAQDNEWFTMTVVAHGRHMATWVNGVQTADWTDNRPLEENARKGAYLKKGPISLQGHDPTTDLLFRNIRIAELPAPSR